MRVIAHSSALCGRYVVACGAHVFAKLKFVVPCKQPVFKGCVFQIVRVKMIALLERLCVTILFSCLSQMFPQYYIVITSTL